MARTPELEPGPPSDYLGNVLAVLARSADFANLELGDILRNVAETAAGTLKVARVNVWLYDEERTQITCVEAFDSRTGQHTRGDVLRASDYPRYFSALDQLRNIAAFDAKEDSRTEELSQTYLAAHSITTILDVPILRSGQVVGVVCHEQVGRARSWSAADRLFAGSIGDLVAQALETNARIEAERERARLVERLARSERVESLGWLAGSVAHDFKNLLFTVLANAELLLSELPADSRQSSMASDIREVALRAGELCDQLLTCAGRKPTAPKSVQLGELVNELGRLLQVRVPSGAQLSTDVPAGIPLVLADPTQLRQVILNLMINALDALETQGSRVAIAVRADAGLLPLGAYDFRSIAEPCVMLEVRDDGVGMDAETQRRALEPFFTTKPNGHGFGLASTLGIVRAHAGALHIESGRGRGTTIRVWLPPARE